MNVAQTGILMMIYWRYSHNIENFNCQIVVYGHQVELCLFHCCQLKKLSLISEFFKKKKEMCEETYVIIWSDQSISCEILIGDIKRLEL